MAAPRAGQPARPEDLVDIARLVTAYYAEHPDPADPAQRVSFGTSGHRGSALKRTFNEDHILATTQAICEYRREQGIDGPLFLAADTHALSEPATVSALEVLGANDVTVLIDSRDGYTPTPALSRAILAYNRDNPGSSADGIVVFSKLCTHAGCPVGLYEQTSKQLFCPCHQSVFNVLEGGRVMAGPAARPLPQLPIGIDDEGYVVAEGEFIGQVGPTYWRPV